MDTYTIRFTAMKNDRIYMDYTFSTDGAPLKEVFGLKRMICAALTDIDKALKPVDIPEDAPVTVATDKHPEEKPSEPDAESRPVGVKGLLILRCSECGATFRTFLREPQSAARCNCGHEIPLESLAYFEAICPSCGMRTYGRTNLESADFHTKCKCGQLLEMEWDAKEKMYLA